MVTALQAKPSGILRVSAATDFGVAHLAPVIGSFLEEFPDLSISLVFQNRLAELISEGFDVVIRVGDLEDRSLRAQKFAQAEKRLVASPAYLARHGTPESIPELGKHQLLHDTIRPSSHIWTLRGPNNTQHQVRAKSTLAINDGQSLLTAAISGLGIAYLPSFLYTDAMRRGLVVDAMPNLEGDEIALQAVYPSGRFTQPKVRAFIDFLLREFSDRGPATW